MSAAQAIAVATHRVLVFFQGEFVESTCTPDDESPECTECGLPLRPDSDADRCASCDWDDFEGFGPDITQLGVGSGRRTDG